MKTLYCSVHTKQEDFDLLFRKSNGKLENVAQKFHSLLSQGISMNLGVIIPVLSCPPANIGKLYAKTDTSKFYYIPVLKFPGLNYLLVWGYMLLFALFWNIGHLFSKRIVYISATTLLKFLPVYIISKLFFAKLVMITCDIPKMTFTQRISHKSTSFKDKIHSFFTDFVWRIASHFNYYVFLTEKMSDVINTHNRPYTVVEGFSDIRMNKEENRLEEKYDKNIIVYAGGIYEKYGVRMLADAVEEISSDNVELWLMGRGEMDAELQNGKYRHVKYLGSKINAEVLQIEKKATLLVNPRFSDEEYTHYSFPSKVMEYFSTGTLALITRLGGIPDEYFDYCETIESETVDGIKQAILKVLDMPKTERHAKGLRAKRFVMENKNNITQTKKILEMVN